MPPAAQALINSIRRTGARSTTELLTALRQLVDLGLSSEEAAVIGMGSFPVGGQATYSDDFLMPRFTGTFHLHQGNDIFATRGTPVRAPGDGSVRFGADPLGGNAAYLTLADGTYYYMAHLDSYAKLASPRVKQGQVIAYVGDTGDAAGSPHLHFEIHPRGGAAINPKPILDRWLDEALANVANILASYQVGVPQAIVHAGALRRFDEPPLDDADAGVLLSTTSAGDGSLRLTELRASRLLADRAKAEAAAADGWRAAEQAARSVLAPLTPSMLQRALVGDAN